MKIALKLHLKLCFKPMVDLHLVQKGTSTDVKVYCSFQVLSHVCGPDPDYLGLFPKILKSIGSSK